MNTNDPRWKTAGAGMTDDEMHFLAKVLKEGPKDPILAKLHKQWNVLWTDWADVGKFQERLERQGVGATEVDNLFKARLQPEIEQFQKLFNDVMGHLSGIANK